MEIEKILNQADRIEKLLADSEKLQEEQNAKIYKTLTQAEIAQAGGIVNETSYNNVRVIRCKLYGCFCILDNEDNTIVPLYKYDFIDNFDSGYARVNVENKDSGIKKWGIIDCKGREVVPLEYDSIWNFYRKGREAVRMEKDGRTYWFDLLNGEVCNSDPWYNHHPKYSSMDEDTYGSHYGEFAGSYAQDVMGYSDDVINDAFEGDPDNYWNID